MKKVLLVVLMIVGITTFAQEKKGQKVKLTPEQQVELRLKKMKLALDLNDSQSDKVRKLVTEQSKKIQANIVEREAKKANNTKPSADEMYQMKSKMLDEQIAMKSEMKKILTTEQFTKWEKLQSKKKENMKHRMGNRKHEQR